MTLQTAATTELGADIAKPGSNRGTTLPAPRGVLHASAVLSKVTLEVAMPAHLQNRYHTRTHDGRAECAVVPIRQLARVLLGSAHDGLIMMIQAYFDDSGTHAGSDLVFVGGTFGSVDQWEPFEAAWKAVLDNPAPHKASLPRFHMAECEAGEGLFADYKPAERDLTIHNFRKVILDSGLYGYAMGISRTDWDKFAPTVLTSILGDNIESFCIWNCFQHVLNWAGLRNEVAFVFDDWRGSSDSRADFGRISDIYQGAAKADSTKAQPLSLTFANSLKTLPLQAADMVAWEMRNCARAWLQDPGSEERQHLQRLIETERFAGQVADEKTLKEIAETSVQARPPWAGQLS